MIQFCHHFIRELNLCSSGSALGVSKALASSWEIAQGVDSLSFLKKSNSLKGWNM